MMRLLLPVVLFALVVVPIMAADGANPGKGQGNGNGNGNGNGRPERDDPGNDDSSVLTEEEIWEQTVTAITELNGWPREDIEAFVDLQTKFSKMLHELEDEEDFADAEMPESPRGKPKIYVKNGPSERIQEKIRTLALGEGQRAAFEVEMVATKFSRRDQEARLDRIRTKLQRKGFGTVVGYVANDRMVLTASKPAGNDAIRPTPPGRGNIPLDRIDEVAREVLGLDEDSDDLYGLQLDIVESDVPLGELTNLNTGTRAGKIIYTSSPPHNECTTAFTVRNIFTGKSGLLTAGHCNADGWTYNADTGDPEGNSLMTEIDNANLEAWPNMHYRYGDLAWYDVDGHEDPKYWVRSWLYTVRDFTWWQPRGSIVCKYSRMGFSYTCNYVYQTGVVLFTFSFSPPYVYVGESLTATTHHVVQQGDSGGPISIGSTAQGVITGYMRIDGRLRDVYSPLQGLTYMSFGLVPLTE